MRLQKQRGVVIVVALFIVALVATMAYIMMARLQRDVVRTTMIIHDVQANALAQGSVVWAMDTLRNNWVQRKQNQLVDAIPIKLPEQEENGFKVNTVIYDMQSRFNLNALTTKEGQESFKRLIMTVAPSYGNDQAQQIVKATAAWIQRGNQGGISKYYSQLAAPYRSAGRPMITPTELSLVKGVTPTLYQAIMPYVTALPDATKINVQTAPAPVLMLLSPKLSLTSAKTIEAQRKSNPFVTPQAFTSLDVVKNHQVGANQFTVISQFFLVETEVTIENQRLVLYTLLMRKSKDKKASVIILWQSKGVW